MPRCRICPRQLEAVSTDGGGLVGWICDDCEVFYPEGEWLTTKDKPPVGNR